MPLRSVPARPRFRAANTERTLRMTDRLRLLAVDTDDLETLQDLVVAAVRDAKRAVDQLAADTMGPLAGGLGGGPGGGLGLPGF